MRTQCRDPIVRRELDESGSRRPRARAALVMIALASLSACAGVPERAELDPGLVPPQYGLTTARLTANDLSSLEGATALDAIMRVRAHWIRGRGAVDEQHQPRVYVDGIRRGGVQELAHLSVVHIAEIRFLGAREATIWLGSDHPGGAILITSRHGPR